MNIWRGRKRRGMTLVEVLVSVVLLAGVLLGLGAFSAGMARTSGLARVTATATQLVRDRLELVKTAPRYTAIESLYVATEPGVSGFSGFTRTTEVRRVGGQPADSIDYKIITVEVAHSAIAKPVRKTTVIAPF